LKKKVKEVNSIFKQRKLGNYFRKTPKDLEDIGKAAIEVPDSLREKLDDKKKIVEAS